MNDDTVLNVALSWSQDSFVKAYRFAARAHRGQLVPGTDFPYLVHVGSVCMEVLAALQVEQVTSGDLAVQSALLHDVIEDTDTTVDQLHAEFGGAIVAGVLALTKNPDLDKSLQTADSLRRIQEQPPEIAMVKMADRITNLAPPPAAWTADKRTLYRAEAIEIHQALRGASPFLAARLWSRIEAYRAFS